MVLTYKQFIAEKMGVPVRHNQNDDVLGISKIVNDFLDNISKNPEKEYSTTYEFLYEIIKIKYIPQDNTVKNGEATDRYVIIHKKLTDTNYLDIKYLIIHELIHVAQRITKEEIKDELSPNQQIRYMLIKPTYEQIVDIHSNYFGYLLYREDIYEISAWSNDAYLLSFKYKQEHPTLPNQTIINNILDKVHMNNNMLEQVEKSIKHDKLTFECVISMLVGHFSELGGQPDQIYFGKEVFELDVVKKMRKELKLILNNLSMEYMVNKIIQMIDYYMPELEKDKEIITNSFIEHLEYWFKKCKLKLGKAIQLGIDDATETKNV